MKAEAKQRWLEVKAEIAENLRRYVCDNIKTDCATRVSLESELAILNMEMFKFDKLIDAQRELHAKSMVEMKGIKSAALKDILIELLDAKGMHAVVEEAMQIYKTRTEENEALAEMGLNVKVVAS